MLSDSNSPWPVDIGQLVIRFKLTLASWYWSNCYQIQTHLGQLILVKLIWGSNSPWPVDIGQIAIRFKLTLASWHGSNCYQNQTHLGQLILIHAWRASGHRGLPTVPRYTVSLVVTTHSSAVQNVIQADSQSIHTLLVFDPIWRARLYKSLRFELVKDRNKQHKQSAPTIDSFPFDGANIFVIPCPGAESSLTRTAWGAFHHYIMTCWSTCHIFVDNH